MRLRRSRGEEHGGENGKDSPHVSPPASTIAAFSFAPIGFVRSPFRDKADAPRQGNAGGNQAEATIVLLEGHDYEHALEDVALWEYLWILFVFDRNSRRDGGFRPKVLPPRSAGKRRGVFSTRSPHRPNPIGMSAVKLVEVRGLEVRVRGVDMLDGTPVLDIKPYVPYADAHPDAKGGWLTPSDPLPPFRVTWSDEARRQLDFLALHGVLLEDQVARALSLGPQPNAYRRIKKTAHGHVLATKEWRVAFVIDEPNREARVERFFSGYRPRELALGDADVGNGDALQVHRVFAQAFPAIT